MFALFPEFGARTRPQDLWPFIISETGLKFLIWTQGEIHPCQPASCEEAPIKCVHGETQSYNVGAYHSFGNSYSCKLQNRAARVLTFSRYDADANLLIIDNWIGKTWALSFKYKCPNGLEVFKWSCSRIFIL